ncbi:MAG: hypothetical protein JWQ71_1062 [Pedosphaera sp.]|nr:hypothetical protein [Pedosphaera sp.]
MSDIPKVLFKYVVPDRIDVIGKLHIRFTQPSRFNDPFEMLPSIDGLEDGTLIDTASERVHRIMYRRYVLNGGPLSLQEFLKIQIPHSAVAIKQLKENPYQLKSRAIARQLKDWDDVIGILSLSAATEKNLLMWAHYTDSHKGMIIEFDPHHPFFTSPGKSREIDFGIVSKVVYSDVRPRTRLNIPPTELSVFRTKSKDWEYEDEWRMYQLLEKSDVKVFKGAEAVHLFKIPPDCIKRVIIGSRMDMEQRTKLLNSLHNNPQLHHVQIHHAVLDLDNFALKYVPLSLL